MLSFTEFWVVIVCYLIFILGIGAFVRVRAMIRSRSGLENENIFASRLSWGQCLMTYLASLMSVWFFFSGPGGYFKGGFVYFMSEVTWLPMYMITAHFVNDRVWAISRRRTYSTPTDFLCDRFQGTGSKLMRLIVGIVFLASAFPYVTSVMVAIAGGAVRISDGSMNYNLVILVIGFAMVIFTMIGGFKSVALTDTIQGLIFMAAIWVIVIAVMAAGYNGNLIECIKDVNSVDNGIFFSYPGPRNWVPYGYRFGYPFALMIGFSVMLPHVFVRATISGRDLKTQRRLATWAPWMRLIVLTGSFMMGVLAFGLMPDMATEEAEYVIPYLLEQILSPANPILAHILMIVFFCGACAVGISTADSYLLSAASIISDDIIFGFFNLKLSDKVRNMIGRAVILIVGGVGVIWSLNPPGLVADLIMFSIAITMPLFPIMVIGMYWKKASSMAALISVILGEAAVGYTYLVAGNGSTYYGALGVLVATIAMLVISPLTCKKEKTNEKFFTDLNESWQEIYKVDKKYAAELENA